MALVDTFGSGAGPSRLLMMQARFQQRQQEEKEHKLFAMLEEQHEGIGLIPATRTHSNSSSQNGQHTSASSTASLTSSLGSSLASSLGSTGSGTGGKVRQMFEERRNNINGRPPVHSNGHSNGLGYGAKNGQMRRASPSKPGWDRSYPLEPMPTTYEKNSRPVPAVNHRYANRSRGVSLERGANASNDPGEMRRSKSQYQVANMAATVDDEANNLTAPNGLKPKSMNSLVDDNQNNMIETRRTGNRFGYNAHGRSPSEPRYRDPAPQYREEGDVPNGNGASRRNHINQQTFRKVPTSVQVNRALANGSSDWSPGGAASSSDDAARAAALAAAEAAAETARKLEAEKLRIQMEAKKREEELMNTIRQQQLQLQRFQQAAALAEQKAKQAAAAAAAAAPATTPRTAATANVVTASKFRRPNADYGTKASAAAFATDESDDSKSTMSDEVFTTPPSKVWPPYKRATNEAPAEAAPPPKPKIAPKPAAAARQPVQRRSIFATAMAAAKEGLVACSICGRNFAADRIEKHESVCAKTKTKKRKVFDITKMRVKGTEAESYVLHQKPTSHAPGPKKQMASGASSSSSGFQTSNPLAAYVANLPSAKPQPQPSGPSEDQKKSDWRKKHESFLETIRAAKAVTKHLKSGGKISDLPPPPPSDTSDYIQCPHCKRRFSPGAADRHIPKCANIKSNKPK